MLLGATVASIADGSDPAQASGHQHLQETEPGQPVEEEDGSHGRGHLFGRHVRDRFQRAQSQRRAGRPRIAGPVGRIRRGRLLRRR